MTTTATPARERLIHWLRDAHAVEKQAETLLGSKLERIEHFPELGQRIAQHLEETRSQATRLEACLDHYDESPSSFKDITSKMSAFFHGLGTASMSDEIVKAMGMMYAFEHMEIAAYKNLVLAARAAGDARTEEVCRAILDEEIAMANWLADHQQAVTERFLVMDAAEGIDAKH